MPNATTTQSTDQAPAGSFISRDATTLYEIRNAEQMSPFLMTIVGDTDLWMYLSSAGSFTAGRVQPDRCIFPYETDDRLHELNGLAGPLTLIRFEDGRIWRPMDKRFDGAGATRVLRRSLVGDMVELEETDSRSGVVFRVQMSLSDTFGVVRQCEMHLADGATPARLELLDGYVNVIPANVPLGLQQTMSTLVDAYKRTERIGEHPLAIYALEATITDRPEATESLRVNAVWHSGLEGAAVCLDESAVSSFERGMPATKETLITGRRGCYLCRTWIDLDASQPLRWSMMADAHLDHAAITKLVQHVSGPEPMRQVEQSLEEDRDRLAKLLDKADGSQATADLSACAAHRSNVLFNSMRGGVPLDDYAVDREDFRRFIHTRHRHIAARHDTFLSSLSPELNLGTLTKEAAKTGDPQLIRLAYEYLPLTFGRRHGDPSRPWNMFRIKVRDAEGNRATGYEGNWRDIFQNWEAVCRSYPAMLPGVIAKFVNASTMDGFNPYRINERGIDWEIIEPEDPRSSIGYWGDHQIVYLHRLLEQCRDTFPGLLETMLEEQLFSFAQVPYQLRAFDQIAQNPRNSIRFEDELDALLRKRTEQIGGDGRLVLNDQDEPVLVTLIEKLLVTALAKVSSLTPNGGIWMNTQRPEWNDANNALAGYGLSMVTLYQLRSFAEMCNELLESAGNAEVRVTHAVATWCESTISILTRSSENLASRDPFNDTTRWKLLEELGRVAENARESLYKEGPVNPSAFKLQTATDFFKLTMRLCDHSIRNAVRADGLYESYSVLHLEEGRATVEPLEPMLEGQVAVLASGVLTPEESCTLLDTLFVSELYREDQRAFMLYPRKDLPSFLDRNMIPQECLKKSPLLMKAIEAPEAGLVLRDTNGTPRFCADLISHEALEDKLAALGELPEWASLVSKDASAVHQAYEHTFHHARFTGRSGTMHKYEGLGSIYWHMMSKLMLATQECVFRAADAGAPAHLVAKLREHYFRVRDGLGYRKSPVEFGAIPHEPYSHTPWGHGAQQPGMTGQVKEGVLARFGELGVRLHRGEIRFDPILIDHAEWLEQAQPMRVHGGESSIQVPQGSVGFTLISVPVILTRGNTSQITLTLNHGERVEIQGSSLPAQWCNELFAKSGVIDLIEVVIQNTP